GFDRRDVDEFAVRSHQRASDAWAKGLFDRSVVPVIDDNGLLILGRDEAVRENASIEDMRDLSPSFEGLGKTGFDKVCQMRYPHLEKIHHVHHAGNSSGMVDGAAAVLLGSHKAGTELGLKPRARIRAYA